MSYSTNYSMALKLSAISHKKRDKKSYDYAHFLLYKSQDYPSLVCYWRSAYKNN